MSVLVIRDLNQIPPISDYILTKNPSDVNDSFARQGLELFNDARKVTLTLTEQVRAQSDSRFGKLCENIRNKQITEDDLNLLESRLFQNLSEEERRDFAHHTFVFGTNKDITQHNKEFLLNRNEPVKLIKPVLNPYCPDCSSQYRPFYGGPNVKVHLTRNLSFGQGLCNSTDAIIIDMCFDKLGSLPAFVVVSVENYDGIYLDHRKKNFADWSNYG